MTITSHQLTELFATPWGSRGVAGKAQAVKRSAPRGPSGHSSLGPQHAAYLDGLAVAPPARRPYDHPAMVPPRPRQSTKPLTPSDIAWLQSLPDDPAQISYDDARALARLDGDFENPGDARLVRSKLGPVRRYHDAKAAQVALDQIRTQPAPNIGDRGVAIDLLATALRNELPADVTDDEVNGRAVSLLHESLDRAARQRQAELDAADAELRRASRPWNPDDMSESLAYAELARAASWSGDAAAGRAVRDHDWNTSQQQAEADMAGAA